MKAIYKITNDINDKVYIGQSAHPKKRFNRHKSDAIKKRSEGKSAIHDAMREIGVEHFSIEIIGWYEDYDEMEQHYIKQYNSIYPNGYNILKGGEGELPHRYGEDHPRSKYSQELVDTIIDDLMSHQYTQKEIQDKYNVTQQLITQINNGWTHKRKGIKYPILPDSNYHCNDKTVDDIVYLLKNSTCTCSEIARYFGFKTSTIKAINSGRNHYYPNLKYPIRNFRGKANSQSVETILAKRSTPSN